MQLQLSLLAALAASASASVLQNIFNRYSDNVGDFGDLVQQAGLYDTFNDLQSVTLFAPTNEALSGFSASGDQLRNALLYHAVNGTRIGNAGDVPENGTVYHTMLQTDEITGTQVIHVLRNGSTIQVYTADGQLSSVQETRRYSQGTVHFIDRVLVAPYSASRTAGDIGLSALAAALPDGTDNLRNITIFAPNDAAFSRVAGSLNGSSDDVINYHICSPSLYTSETIFANGATFTTEEGDQLRITEVGDAVYVNNARIIYPNILVANGVLHIIDQVLNPSSTQAPPSTATGGVVAFSDAQSSAIPTSQAAVSLPSNTFTGVSSTTHSRFEKPTDAAAVLEGSVGYAALFAAGAAYAAM